MQCPRCKQENPSGSSFCSSCGAGLGLTCPSCRHSNPAGSRYCNACGASLGATSTPAGPPFASPASYTPKHLAEKILTSRAALEGEREHVTVLFADLKGSMELLTDRDPEEARKVLDPVLGHMMDAVHRYEGTVNQVMGDGIMALFGAPIAHEDHAVRACYAALRMQESVNRYAEEARRAHGVTVQIRVGLNSGEVVVRAIGNDLHMDYTAVGETTHLAARMEQAARPGTVLIAPATLNLVEGFVAVKSLGPVPVKGRREPIEVYELSGPGPARTRLQAAARRGLTRFVGRDAEIEVLRRVAERASATRASGRHRWRGRRWEIAPRLGVHAVAAHPRLAGARNRLGLLWEDHAVPARHSAAEDISQHPGARRPAGNEAWALRLLGEIASHHIHPNEATATAHYGAAMTLASELRCARSWPTATSASAGSTGGRVIPSRPRST